MLVQVKDPDLRVAAKRLEVALGQAAAYELGRVRHGCCSWVWPGALQGRGASPARLEAGAVGFAESQLRAVAARGCLRREASPRRQTGSRAQVPFLIRRKTPYYEMGYLLLSVSKATRGFLRGFGCGFRKVVA